MRRIFTALHRWLGLSTALFLFVAGSTGALIAWDHELDALLNPALYHSQSRSSEAPQSVLALADLVEQREPHAAVRFLPLSAASGDAVVFFMEPRIDPATNTPYELGFNQIAVDPITGDEQGRREWGAFSVHPTNLMPFLYRLHYTLHVPQTFGTDLGRLVMGIVAIIWVLDTLISLAISFPSRKVWKRSFAYRWKQGGFRLLFDLHRSSGVWIWLLLLTMAFTSVSMNLGDQVVRPIVGTFSTLTPDAFDAARERRAQSEPHRPKLGRAAVVEIARGEGKKRGWPEPPGGMFFDAQTGLYGVGFYELHNDHGDGGLGNRWLYFDGDDGSLAGQDIPGEGSAGDVFMAAQFPIHSGRIFGVAGRILISLLGVTIAMLSVTGIVIWVRRQRKRAAAAVALHKPPPFGVSTVPSRDTATSSPP